jgi:DNA-binding NarL/FixJ family response regulator
MASNRLLREALAKLLVRKGEFRVCGASPAGATGYLLKDASAAEVVAGVRAVAQGHAVCSPELCAHLFEIVAQSPGSIPSSRANLSFGLTRRQQQIVPLIGQGLTNKEIASILNLSEQTVKNHVHGIMQSVGVKNRLDVIDATQRPNARPSSPVYDRRSSRAVSLPTS